MFSRFIIYQLPSINPTFSSRLVTRCFSSNTKEFKLQRFFGEDDGIVQFILDRPDSRNALGKQMMMEFRQALDSVKFDHSIRAIILTSNVPKVFCAGADLKERAQMSPEEVEPFVAGLRATFSDLADLPIPTIAVIEGAALGGGLELALSCDMRVAGANASLGLPETGLAIIPGAGGTQRLPRLIGLSKAKELIFTGQKLTAEQALQIGLVNHAVPAETAFEKGLEIARMIKNKGPIALRMAKIAISEGIQTSISTGMQIEKACYAQTINTQDRLEGLAAFKEKRQPQYTGK